MRFTSLAILIIVVLLVVYFVFLTPPWAVDLYNKSTGFGPAETPTDAIDKFIKCVKKRDLNTAAKFCTADYAALLKRGATATAEMGPVLDSISDYMRNKGLATDKSVTLLHFIDPFPTNLKMAAAPKERDATKAVGFLQLENIWPNQKPVDVASLVRTVDPKMFSRVLLTEQVLLNPNGFELVKDDEGWKLNVPVPPVQVQFLDYYLNNYKGYHTGLTVFRRDVTNERYPSKQEFENELESVFEKAKG